MPINKRHQFPKILLLIAIAMLIWMLSQSLSFKGIGGKLNANDIRIGYINLNKTQVTAQDLKTMQNYNCDVWLFAEWNGNNLNALPEFESAYARTYDKSDTFTYGYLVLSKQHLNLSAKAFNEQQYACDYDKILITSESFHIAFLHAPPPVPSCDFETKQYVEDALDAIQREHENGLLIGDFNAVPITATYNRITQKGYQDAFQNDGTFAGTFGFFAKFPKWLRIDYCFTKGKIDIVQKWRFETQNSDHCGLIVDMKNVK